ncbi:hypothetical protein QQ045_033248 [Rhodiola kirilowii]
MRGGTHPQVGDDLQLSPILLDTRDSGPSFLATGTPSPTMLVKKSIIPILATVTASPTIQGDEAGLAINPHSSIAAELATHGTAEPNKEVMNSTGKLSMVLEHSQVMDPNVSGGTDGKTSTEVINVDIESTDLQIPEEFAQKFLPMVVSCLIVNVWMVRLRLGPFTCILGQVARMINLFSNLCTTLLRKIDRSIGRVLVFLLGKLKEVMITKRIMIMSYLSYAIRILVFPPRCQP